MNAGRARRAAEPSRVLVTDGEFKHTLGIVRALAARGHEVHLLAHSPWAPAARSRAVRRTHRVPRSGDAEFAPALLERALALAPVTVLPVGSGAVAAAQGLRGRWPADVRVALAPAEGYATAMDKHRTAALARQLGIATPAERRVTTVAAARDAAGELRLPLVIKSAREEGIKVLRYVHRTDDLEAAARAVLERSTEGALVQERVAGAGYGFSALYWQGTQVRGFMHRRVREWPPTGGTSAAAESVPHAPELERAGTALLDALAWHGVAMVEFKGRPEPGALHLIEINAKFWGSHDLALAAGVDFPGDLVALLEGGSLGPQPPVRAVRFSWPLGGDLWHGLFRPAALPRVLADALSPGVAHGYRPSDPLPLLYAIAQWVRGIPGAFREQRDLR